MAIRLFIENPNPVPKARPMETLATVLDLAVNGVLFALAIAGIVSLFWICSNK